MNFIDCKSVREQILTEVTEKVADIQEPLRLVIFQIGDHDASKVYVKNKLRTCEEVGIFGEVVKCQQRIQFVDLQYLIQAYADMKTVTGIMIQLPLPEHLKARQQDLLDLIPWQKDVDGLSSASAGRLWNGQACIVPATPGGVMHLLPNDMRGQTVTIVNRSNLIGKPLTKLLLDRNATVTVCHSKSSDQDIRKHLLLSDVVITGVGEANHFDYPWLSDGQTWIDCGINRDKDGHLCGDVNPEAVTSVNGKITPVPGGVGILTTAQLMANVVKAYRLQGGNKR